MKALIKNALAGLGYELHNTRLRLAPLVTRARSVSFDDVVCRLMFERGEALSFVQVGAFDGQTRDPLHRYVDRCGWRGVLLEPQPGPAAALRELYKSNERVRVVEAALGPAPGAMTLYAVDSTGWAGGLASFDRSVIAKHRDQIPDIEDRIREISVPCVTFAQVLTDPPDILQIDTEGADGYILSLFPFDRFSPAIVQLEIKHLPWPERASCLERLAGLGYRLAQSDEDVLATLI